MVNFTPEQIEQLQAPLDGSQVKTREQAGRSLSYIEGWAAIDTANRIFGHGEWGYIVSELTHIGTREVHNDRTNRDGWEVGYRSRVIMALTGGTTYEDVGYGTGTDYNSPFAAHESAGKEAVTDALKRALKNLGYPFGLALYDKTQEHVEYNDEAPSQTSHSAPSRPSQPASGPAGSGAKEASDKQVKMLFALGHKLGMAVQVQESVHAIKAKNGIIPMAWVSKQIDRLQALPVDDGDQRKAEAREPDGSESFEEWIEQQNEDTEDIPFI